MTCIIGIETEDGLWMGCDSGSSDGWNGRISIIEKIFYRERFLIGFTTSWRMGQIARYHAKLDFPKQGPDETDEEYLVMHFIEAIRKEFVDRGFARIDDNEQTGGQLLVGYKGKIYLIDNDFQINRFSDGYNSIGGGAQYALGALAALDKMYPRQRILRALRIASMFSNGVVAPFNFYKLSDKDEFSHE